MFVEMTGALRLNMRILIPVILIIVVSCYFLRSSEQNGYKSLPYLRKDLSTTSFDTLPFFFASDAKRNNFRVTAGLAMKYDSGAHLQIFCNALDSVETTMESPVIAIRHGEYDEWIFFDMFPDDVLSTLSGRLAETKISSFAIGNDSLVLIEWITKGASFLTSNREESGIQIWDFRKEICVLNLVTHREEDRLYPIFDSLTNELQGYGEQSSSCNIQWDLRGKIFSIKENNCNDSLKHAGEYKFTAGYFIKY